MTLRSIVAASALALSPIALALPALAQAAPVYTAKNSQVAVNGYDPVAYFTAGEPVKGSEDFTATHHGAEFRFANQENLDTFLGDPDKYAPQFGGYCAWAVSQGYTAPGNPKNWAVVDGKLYLNYNSEVQNTWNAERDELIPAAATNWPGLVGAQDDAAHDPHGS